jgi:hypothetical protein
MMMESQRNDDRLAIHELTLRYAQAIDSRNYTQLREIFLPEATITGPGFDYPDLAIFEAGLTQNMGHFSATMHALHNQLIEFQSDQTAEVESYFVANHLYERDGEPRKLDWGICYRDHCVQKGGRWWLIQRELELRWQQDLPLSAP